MKLRLTKDQKNEYLEKKIYFDNGIFKKSDKKDLLNFYLYEIADGSESTEPDLNRIVTRLFAARDQIHEVNPDNTFMIRLCESFMIAHPEITDQVVSLMQKKGICSYEAPFEAVRSGDYSAVESYIKTFAKGLKESERTGEKTYIIHSFHALEEVCYQLEEAFRDYKGYLREASDRLYGVAGFRELMAAVREEKTFLNPIELNSFSSHRVNRIMLSRSASLIKERNAGKEQWVRTEWTLSDCTADFLFLIYQFTQSVMREALSAPAKKRSIDKYMKKSYARGKTDKRIISLFKKYISNSRFEAGIRKGVDRYLLEHSDIIPAKKQKEKSVKKEKPVDLKEQMNRLDAGQNTDYAGVDKKKLKNVKDEAGEVIGLLHVEEIPYDSDSLIEEFWEEHKEGDLYTFNHCEQARKTDRAVCGVETSDTPEEHSLFNETETGYLKLLICQNTQSIPEFVKAHKTSERLIVKSVNEKFIQKFDDILIENTGREFVIIEDYLNDLTSILEE